MSRSAYLARQYSGGNKSSTKNYNTGQSGGNRIRDTKADQEKNEGSYLDRTVPGTNQTFRQKRNEEANAAFRASQERQENLRQAIDLVNSQRSNESGFVDLKNFSDKQLEDIAKTGLFAMEASGDLGGTFGAELVSNQIKKQIQNATTQEELDAAFAAMDRLTGDTKITDQMGKMGLLSFDPTAVFSFGDVESDPNLKFSYYGLQNKNASADQIRQFLPNVYGYGGGGSGGMGGFGGGYGYGYGGGGGGGGGGFGYNMNMGMQGQPKQRAQVGPGGLQEQVNQAFLSGGKPFAKGGIVSLVED